MIATRRGLKQMASVPYTPNVEPRLLSESFEGGPVRDLSRGHRQDAAAISPVPCITTSHTVCTEFETSSVLGPRGLSARI